MSMLVRQVRKQARKAAFDRLQGMCTSMCATTQGRTADGMHAAARLYAITGAVSRVMTGMPDCMLTAGFTSLLCFDTQWQTPHLPIL